MTAQKILVIRRENIGDLVCTTPLLRALRGQLPNARIIALATRYNAAVLNGNPDIDAAWSYTKAKHRAHGESAIVSYLDRLRMIVSLRRENFNWVLLPGGPHASALRFARWIGGERLLVRGPEDAVAGLHEVEQTCHLLQRMGLRYETPAPLVIASRESQLEIDRVLDNHPISGSTTLIGLHISARKPSQRWPAERFIDLIKLLVARPKTAVALLWAPGAENDPHHPGDDDKAAKILENTYWLPIIPIPTQRLETLTAAISRCSTFICSDGGAMHLAAGLAKPIVALFGQSDASHWRPWAVPQVILQKPSRNVVDIDVSDVLAAYTVLIGKDASGFE
jgi:heptosyltransferase-3